MNIRSLSLVNLVFILLILGCNSNNQTISNSPQKGDALSTSSQEISTVKYAKTFRLEYKDSYKLLHLVNPFSETKQVKTFVLIQDHQSIPAGYKKTDIIRIPIKKMITTTTAQTSMIEALGSIDAIKGYVSKDYMYSQNIVDKMEAEEIITIGYDLNANTEKIIAANADLVMVVGSSTTNSSSFPILQKVGIPVLANTDWQENHLLGRAEWIKVFGALFHKEKEANQIFNEVESKFNEYLALAETTQNQPSVISGLPYKGMWSVPGGQSYLALAFQQANANYPWKETTQTGSLQFDLEGVFAKGGDADFWLNVGTLTTLKAIENNDSRYLKFKAFQNKQVYNNNKRLRNATANDYWGTGILHPELIMGDLIKIFHPELLPNYELFFYHKLK